MSENETLPYDPVLKVAMEEIKAILDKYDIGANIILGSKTHSEYFYDFPTWSIVQFAEKGSLKQGLKIVSKRKDYKSLEEQHQISEYSTGLIARNRDMAAQTFSMFQDVFEQLENHFEIEHKPFSGHTPHMTH